MVDVVDLTLQRGLMLSSADMTTDDELRRSLLDRLNSLASDHNELKKWCDRVDQLYFPTAFTAGGADLWPNDPTATTPGKTHVSVNTMAVYVDIPAALQAIPAIENMLATKDTDEARLAASAFERIRAAWKFEESWDLKRHKAITTKALYGDTASYVYWDEDDGRPCADIIQNPRNLYLGYKADDYEEVEWAACVARQDPNYVMEQFSVDVTVRDVRGISDVQPEAVIPWVTMQTDDPWPQYSFGPARIEVWDYWYRKPSATRGRMGKPTRMETWNVVIAGNTIVRGPYRYPEYDGEIPYVPLRNTFIPSVPHGKPELWDVEPLLREKMERITSGSQMIAGATAGDFWQLVGQDAPSRSNSGSTPVRNQVYYPGPGNRIEAIIPFVAQFQLESHLNRLDRETAIASGLSDILLGLSPLQALSSSKAVNALMAQYETRLLMRRGLLYEWDRETWELVVKVWAKKDKTVKTVLDAGGGRLDIADPSLNPRDELETATRAVNLMNAKVWSQARAMSETGVDDTETEQGLIREEQTDATMFPASVMVMAQVLAALQSQQLQPSAGMQQQAQAQLSSGQQALGAALGQATPQNTTGSQLPGDQGITPPEALTPGAPSPGPFAQGQTQPSGAEKLPVLQSMVQGGKLSGRILSQKTIGRR